MTILETILAGLLFLSPAYADTKPESRLQKELDAQCLALNMLTSFAIAKVEANNIVINEQIVIFFI